MEPPESDEGELARLRLRVAELERQAEEHQRTQEQLRDSERRFRLFTAVTNEAVSVTDQGLLIDISPEFEALFGYKIAELLGRSPAEIIAPEFRDLVTKNMRAGYEAPYEAITLHKDGSRIAVQIRGKGLEYQGRTVRVTAVADIRERRRAEEARKAAAVQEETIRAQADMLAQLSTPLLPIGDRVVVLPLIGEINATRAAQLIEALSRGIFEHRAAIALVDITGVRVVGAAVADMLVHASGAARLLGARVILTGVRPEVAQTIIELGKDLGGIAIHGTLQQGVTYALQQTRS